MSHPNAEGSPTSAGSITVTAEDACSSHGFVQLMFLVIATQKPMLVQVSNGFAVRALGELESGVQILKLLFGRTDSTAHDRHPQHDAS